MNKNFVSDELVDGLNDLLDDRDARTGQSSAAPGSSSQVDLRPSLFILHTALSGQTGTVVGSRLVEVPDLGDKKAFQFVFEGESTTLTVNGTQLADTYDDQTTTAELQADLDNTLGANHGVEGAVVAGHLAIWRATTVTAGNSNITVNEVRWRPLWEPAKQETLSAPTPGSSADAGSIQPFLWMNGFGWSLMVSGAASGSGTGGDCCCGCQIVAPGNLAHPAGFSTRRVWQLVLKKETPATPTDDATGFVALPAGSFLVIWNGSASRWEADISDSVIVTNSAGEPGSYTSRTGTIIAEYVAGADTTAVISFDAVGVS